MPEFMVMILESEREERKLAPSETKALLEGRSAWERELRAVSAYRDGERLRPTSEGRRVSKHDGRLRVDAGPFGERTLSAYCVVEAAGLDEALKLAEMCPLAPGAALEVRPLMKGMLQPDRANQKGRLFAFAVLGSAPSEQSWIEVMDRIDESTRNHFPADRFSGGVRLQEPGRGRGVASAGGRRAVFDGPFLESKEVIGGLFFMRMASLEEAVDWAGGSEYVKHGTLEIRELWRS
jgi:hypothetical protein